MRLRNLIQSLAVAILTGGIATLGWCAPDTVDLPWTHICQAADGRELRLTTNTGDTIEGYCVSVNVDEISVQTKEHRAVKIARSTMARMAILPRERQLQALGRGMHRSLRIGARALFSPMAPAGLVLIPGTLAWGAVSAPFCATGDLFIRKSTETEIRPH